MTPQSPLPTEADFSPNGGDLDTQCAWENFGGLTLDQAAEKFRQNPEYYQEDFMFMGGKAFAFYFPVVDAYLRDVPKENDGDDRCSWIIARGIKSQFEADTANYVLPLTNRVAALSTFVQRNIHRFACDADDERRIAGAWKELDACLAKPRSPIKGE